MKLAELPQHHAVLLTHRNRRIQTENLWKELSGNSPAHRSFNATVLDIDTAKEIISWAKSSYNDLRYGLISFHTASLPAQNALLKILEEPQPLVRFILVTSNKENLLDTVLSRLHHIHQKEEEPSDTDVLMFLSVEPSLRMKLPHVTNLLSQTDEEGRKDRERVRLFILSVAITLGILKVAPRYIEETLELASYASDPSASGKALLEYLSLLLPKYKV